MLNNLKLIESKHKDALPYLQLYLTTSKCDVFRKDVCVTISNTGKDHFGLNPLLSLFKAWEDRLKRNEKLVAANFVFGVKDGKTERPLLGSYCNDLYKSLSCCLFGEMNSSAVRTHSARKGGASSLLAAGGDQTEVRLLGRWSLGVLDFYIATEPEKFVELHKRMAEWAERMMEAPEYVAPLEIILGFLVWFRK